MTAKWDWQKHYRQTLEIDNPLATCGSCQFSTALDGTWTVEDGRLVFRAMLNPLTRRGPSVGTCGEGRHEGSRDGIAVFRWLTVDGKPLSDEEYAAVKAAAASPEAWEEEVGTQ